MSRNTSSRLSVLTAIALLGCGGLDTDPTSVPVADAMIASPQVSFQANPGSVNYLNRIILENIDLATPPNYPTGGWSPGGRSRLSDDVQAALVGKLCAAVPVIRDTALTSERYFIQGNSSEARDAFLFDWDLVPLIENCEH